MFPEACAGKASTPDTRVVARVGHALITAAPMLLIVASLGLAFAYHAALDDVIYQLSWIVRRGKLGQPFLLPVCGTANNAIELTAYCDVPKPAEILAVSYTAVPSGVRLMATYLAFFLSAEAAFVLMATREYVQDLLQLTDLDLIHGNQRQSPRNP